MTLLDVALDCTRRGWYVFPCVPEDKRPLGGLVPNGFLDASNDEDTIRRWWTAKPDANVGIACSASGLAVLDADHGLKSLEDFVAWRDRNGLPVTYTVRSGRRFDENGNPEFGAQSYYAGRLKQGKFELDGVTGDIKSTGLVLANGSIHPVSKEKYQVIVDAPIVPLPDSIEQSRKQRTDASGKREWPLPVRDGDGRDDFLIQQAGRMRNVGASESVILAHLEELNSDPAVMADPKSDADLERIAHSAARYDVPAPDPVAFIGKKESKEPEAKQPVDWRTHWHTFDQLINAPKPSFLIEDFLQRESITAIAAPVGQRKSIIALNVAHALCTKEPLFDRFAVNEDANISRVLYLCPEMGLTSFRNRVIGIGLAPYAENLTFLCRTMSPVNPDDKEERELKLDELMPEEVDNAVVIIDTAVRYIEGDENSSSDMRKFAKTIFSLVKMKAAAVVVLFHSGKETKASNEVTLENVMRGSGELGAFVTCCWGTKLQDQSPGAEYSSRSYLRNCKPRDFDTKPFEVEGTEPYTDFRLRFVQNEGKVILTRKQGGVKADADGKDEARTAIIRGNIHLTLDELEKLLKDAGMSRGLTWIKAQRKAIRLTLGAKLVSG